MTPPAPRLTFRRARRRDARPLTELALRAKASWGYDDEFLSALREVAAITPEAIDAGRVVVAEVNGVAVGFYRVELRPPNAWLEDLYVEPDGTSRAVATQLWKHAVEAALAAGCTRLCLDADPHAVAFYRRMGAYQVGERESRIVDDRMLPIMEADLLEIAYEERAGRGAP